MLCGLANVPADDSEYEVFSQAKRAKGIQEKECRGGMKTFGCHKGVKHHGRGKWKSEIKAMDLSPNIMMPDHKIDGHADSRIYRN